MSAVWRVRAVSKNRYLMTTKMTRMAIIYKDIEGELGGQLGDAIGGQGGEFAGEMVSPLFLPFPCCNGIRWFNSRASKSQ